MSKTIVLGCASLDEAQTQAVVYSRDHKVMVIGPTDQVMVSHGDSDETWRSGGGSDLYLMIATKDALAGPRLPAATKAGGEQ